jgi:hypothetical protein
MKTTVRPAVVWFTATLFLAVGLLAQWREVSRFQEEVLRLEQAQSQPPEPRQPEEVKTPTPAEITRTVARPTELEELRQVRAESVESKRRLQQLEAVASENEALRKQMAVAQEALTNRLPPSPVVNSTAPYPDWVQLGNIPLRSSPALNLQEKINGIMCENHLHQITLAADLWATTHDGYGPKDLMDLQIFLAPMILVCPGSRPKSVASHWQNFDASMITYRLRSPGIKWKAESKKFVDCPIHQTSASNWPRETGIPTRFVQ